MYDGGLVSGRTTSSILLAVLRPGDQLRKAGVNVVVSVLMT